MRVLVVYSHPVETIYNASVHAQVVESLHTAGHVGAAMARFG